MNRSANLRGRSRWTNRRTWPRTKSSRWSHRFLDSTLGFMLYSLTAVSHPCCVGVHAAGFHLTRLLPPSSYFHTLCFLYLGERWDLSLAL